MRSMGCFPNSHNDLIRFFCTSIIFALVELNAGKSCRVKTDEIFGEGVEILKKTIGIRKLIAGISAEGDVLNIDDGFTLSWISLVYARDKHLGVEINFLWDFLENLQKLANGENIANEEIDKLIDYFEFVSRTLRTMPSESAVFS